MSTVLDAPTAPTLPSVEETTIVEHDRIVDKISSDDPEQSAHIVLVPSDKKDTHTAQSWVTEARIFGYEVEALCGHRWVPARNPDQLPLCQRCEQIYRFDPKGHNDRDELPDA